MQLTYKNTASARPAVLERRQPAVAPALQTRSSSAAGPRQAPILANQHVSLVQLPTQRAAVLCQALAGQNGTSVTLGPKYEPSEEVMKIWRGADAVCFDVDCTITTSDSLDLLAHFLGCGEEVEALTSQAMDGVVSLQKSLEQRLEIIDCTPADIKRFIAAHPPKSRMVPGIEELIKTLHARGVSVYLISGGFRETILPIAAHLGVPKENVFANRMTWQWDEETLAPTKLVGFDVKEPTARNKGKVAAIAQIRKKNPYNNIVMIGDGITDLEAVQSSHGADLFIGYGGVIERPDVAAQADWFIHDYEVLLQTMKRYQVACVGSGAWACAAVRMIAQNTSVDDPADEFVDDVKIWVHEAEHEGRKLVDIINESHENVVYLPGVDLGENVVATSSLAETVKDADCIVLCAPHQYVHGICKQLQGKIKPGAMVISLTKGMRVKQDGPQLISAMVQRYLGVDCSVLMGANIAGDVAKEQLSEAVIGYNNLENAKVWKKLFRRPYFRVDMVPDVAGAEMCGTLKNVVALGAGMVDGLGYGSNSKAAIIRQGLQEMRDLSKALYPTVRDETFFHTCGMGDLITTCYGGRNRLVAEAWTKHQLAGENKSFEDLETELLNGQKLQGVLTSDEVQEILKMKRWEAHYPLFTTVNRIVNGYLPPSWILRYEEGATLDLGSISINEDDELEIPIRKPSAHSKRRVEAPNFSAPLRRKAKSRSATPEKTQTKVQPAKQLVRA